MTGYRVPGATCATTQPPIDVGTLCIARAAISCPIGSGANGWNLHKRAGRGTRPASRVPGLSAPDGDRAIREALATALELLERRRGDMRAWSADTEDDFLSWFGTTDQKARAIVSKRIEKAIAKLKGFSMKDFVAIPKPVRGRLSAQQYQDAVDDYDTDFAYVRPGIREHGRYEGTVHIGPQFAAADKVTRAGTLIHEVSHFETVANTDDVADTFPGDTRPDKRMYGYTKATRLSMKSEGTAKNKALKNADNFEFFIERHDPADHPLDLDGAGDFPAMSGNIL